MAKSYNISDQFGVNLAQILSNKILPHYQSFDAASYQKSIDIQCTGMTYSQRVELHSQCLKTYLPNNYQEVIAIILKSLGPENLEETGTFKNFYWVLPFSKYVQNFGLEYCELSLDAIEEITKRSTGEYALRPFIMRYPDLVLNRIKKWACDDNFHLRRLASEGLRPKLPWAPKLELFIDQPNSVFKILELLKEDDVKYVKRSVANHLTDYLKVNPEPTLNLLRDWIRANNDNTLWIVKHANRKLNFVI